MKKYLFYLFFTSAIVLCLAYIQVTATRLQIQRYAMENEIRVKTLVSRHLKCDIEDRLKTPSRIRTLAKNRLDMAVAAPERVIYLSDRKDAGGANLLAKASSLLGY